MAEPTKKKITFQIKINQEGHGLDHRNIQNVEVWVPEDKPDPRVHPKGYVTLEEFQSQFDEAGYLRARNHDLKRSITDLLRQNELLKRDLDQANATLKKIENIVVPF